MAASLIWAIVLGVGAIAATIFTPVILPKFSQPKRQLKVEFRSKNLFPAVPRTTGKLSVTHEGRALQNPYHVIVAVSPSGRDDVTTANFDGRRPIVLSFKRTIVPGSIVQGPMNGPNAFEIGEDGKSVELAPTSFQSDGSGCAASFIIEGEPDFSFHDPLVNARLVLASNVRAAAQLSRTRLESAKAMLIFAVMTFGIKLLWALTAKEGQSAPAWVDILLTASASALAVYAVVLLIQSAVIRFKS